MDEGAEARQEAFMHTPGHYHDWKILAPCWKAV